MIIMPDEPMSRITSRIYVGAFYAAQNLAFRNSCDITHILNCTPDKHRDLDNFNITQISIDDGFEIPEEYVWQAINVIHNAVKNGGKILVHCHAGISRSSSLVCGYLAWMGMSWDEAVEFVRSKRPQIHPHSKIAYSVKKALGLDVIDSHTSLLLHGDIE